MFDKFELTKVSGGNEFLRFCVRDTKGKKEFLVQKADFEEENSQNRSKLASFVVDECYQRGIYDEVFGLKKPQMQDFRDFNQGRE